MEVTYPAAMRWDGIGEMVCSLARTLSVIGDRWTVLILRQSFAGTRRFGEFQAQLGITSHRLAERLGRLVDAGVLVRSPYQERPFREEYRLTEMGLDLYPVLLSMHRFGDRWLAGDAGVPIVFVHATCGHDSAARVVCAHCGEPVAARDVVPELGPAVRARMRARAPR